MNRRRLLGSAVLAAGALASIATSQLAWQLDDAAPLPALILDVAQPSVRYAVHAELTGPVTEPDGGIDLQLTVSFPPDRLNPAALRVVLSDDDDPDNVQTVDLTVTPEAPSVYAYLDAWTGCEAAPCVEDFTVTIERTDLTGPPITPIMIGGEVRVSVDQIGEAEPPADAAVSVTVETLP